MYLLSVLYSYVLLHTESWPVTFSVDKEVSAPGRQGSSSPSQQDPYLVLMQPEPLTQTPPLSIEN